MTSRLPRVIRCGLFLFRRLMALMPDSYTSEQREDAIQLSVTLATETRDRRGTLAAMRVTLRVLCDLVGQVMRERLRPVDRRIIDDRRSFADRLRLILDTIGRDIRDGFRAAVARPGQSAAIVATLALGIGLNAAVFSVVDWVLLRPLPYPEPELLARVWTADKASAGVPSDVTYSELERLSRATSFQAAAGFSTITSVMTGQDLEPGHVVVVRMTGDLFRVFGTYPVVGRPFDAAELQTGQPVAVVSESIWRNRLSADRAVVGRLITLDAKQYTIAGVMPAHRGYPTAADVWRPSTAPEREDDDRENVMVARMRAGVDEASFTRNLATERTVHLERLQATEVRNVRTAVTWVFAAAALVLLVACLNIASLAGARGSERAGELAVRGALGAGRLQLVRQLIVESVMLASVGGAIGVALGAGMLDLIVAVAPGAMPRLDEVSLDGRVISVSAIVILMVGVLVGTAPAWRATRVDLRRVLVSAGTPRASSPAGTRRVLVVVQMIAAVVLTVGAGLLARSFQQLMAIDHGFDPDRLLAINLNLRGVPPGDAPGLFNGLIETAQGVPGVQSATAAFRVPTQIEGLRVPVRIESAAMRDSQATLRVVMPGYFDTMAIRLREGRSLATTDTRPSPRVAVVNESFVRDVLGGLPAINTALTTDLVDQRVTIVGVVSDVTPQGQPDRPALYVSFHQFAINAGSLLVRTHGDPAGVLPALTRRLRASAPTLALDRTLIMNDALAAGRSVTRFNTLLASSFGVLALILAVIGIYGLASGDVEARRFEAGLRTALGATPRDIVWGLVRPMGTLLLIGLVGGMATAGAVASAMRSLFYGISPGDPITFVVIPLFIALCGASATLIASRPLLRANPVMTLRR